MEIPAIDLLAIFSAFTVGVVSKYLDDLQDFRKAFIAMLIATVPAAIFAYVAPEMFLGIVAGVYIAGKIDTKILSFYFIYLVAIMMVVDVLFDIKLRLLPLLVFTFAAAYDEKEIRLFGIERLFLPLSALMFIVGGLLMEWINISVGALDAQTLFNVGFRSLVYLIAFDIGYRITAWLIDTPEQ